MQMSAQFDGGGGKISSEERARVFSPGPALVRTSLYLTFIRSQNYPEDRAGNS